MTAIVPVYQKPSQHLANLGGSIYDTEGYSVVAASSAAVFNRLGGNKLWAG